MRLPANILQILSTYMKKVWLSCLLSFLVPKDLSADKRFLNQIAGPIPLPFRSLWGMEYIEGNMDTGVDYSFSF